MIVFFASFFSVFPSFFFFRTQSTDPECSVGVHEPTGPCQGPRLVKWDGDSTSFGGGPKKVTSRRIFASMLVAAAQSLVDFSALDWNVSMLGRSTSTCRQGMGGRHPGGCLGARTLTSSFTAMSSFPACWVGKPPESSRDWGCEICGRVLAAITCAHECTVTVRGQTIAAMMKALARECRLHSGRISYLRHLLARPCSQNVVCHTID